MRIALILFSAIFLAVSIWSRLEIPIVEVAHGPLHEARSRLRDEDEKKHAELIDLISQGIQQERQRRKKLHSNLDQIFVFSFIAGAAGIVCGLGRWGAKKSGP